MDDIYFENELEKYPPSNIDINSLKPIPLPHYEGISPPACAGTYTCSKGPKNKWVGQIIVGENSWGTAFVAEYKNKVFGVTAAHCLWDSANKNWYSPNLFKPNLQNKYYQITKRAIKNTYRKTPNDSIDYGAFLLADADISNFDWGGILLNTTTIKDGFSIGYPGNNKCGCTPVPNNIYQFPLSNGQQDSPLMAACSAVTHGVSGGPWMTEIKTKKGEQKAHRVMGMTVSGNEDSCLCFSPLFDDSFGQFLDTYIKKNIG